MLHDKRITLVVAMAKNRAIGLDGQMPWHLPRELKHFKETTMGHPILMGRKTHESIGRALPGRQNIVISRDPNYRAEGCDSAVSLEDAVSVANGEEIMVIGGGQIYKAAFAYADRLVLTLVDCSPSADTWFPGWDESEWRVVARREEQADESNAFSYSVLDLIRDLPGT